MKTYLAFTFSFLALLAGSRADLTIVSEIKSSDVNPTGGNMTMQLAGGKVRVDTGPAHMIVLPSEKKLLVLVAEQKMCMVKSLDDPAGQPSKTGEPPVVERTGKKETISGFDCEQVLLKDKKGGVTEIWTSPAAPDMSEFVSTFQTVARLHPAAAKYDWTGTLSQKDLNTYPIRVIRYDNEGKEETRMTVLSINKDTVPPSVFAVPAGYQTVEMPDFGGLGGTDIGSSPANPMQALQEMQKKMQNGQKPSAEDIRKMQEQLQQMQPK